MRVRIRRMLSRLDHSAPAWLTELPSWGISLLLHAVVLMILATLIYVGNQREPKVDFDSAIISLADEDFTSLTPAPRSGDAFTKQQTTEMPSIALDSSDRGIKQPSLPIMKLDSTFSLSEKSSASRDGALSDVIHGSKLHTEDMTAPFSGRSGASKAQLVRREGGTPASEKAVAEGLNWLMRHQRDDGGWSLNTSNECKIPPGCPDEINAVSDTAATGLALLPFLGAGHIHTQPSRYSENVRRGIDWLISHQQKDGQLFLEGGFNFGMYSHAIATMALCEAYGLSKDPRLKEPAQLGINFIAASQNKEDGGWRYTPGMPGDTSVFGWQMFALRSARLSGLNVSRNVIKGCVHYLDEAGADKHRTTYGYLPGRPATPVMTAEGLLCRQYLGWPRDYPAMVRGTANVWNELQDYPNRNIYYWYYATQLLHNMHNKQWKLWNERIRETLVNSQVTGDGCDRGSWSPMYPQVDMEGRKAGRLFQTSLSILTLEVYYRFLPLYRDIDQPLEDKPKL